MLEMSHSVLLIFFDLIAGLTWVASDSHVQSDPVAHSCSMETYWDVPPAAVPMSSDHTAEAQGIWLPPASVGTGVVETPTVTVVA